MPQQFWSWGDELADCVIVTPYCVKVAVIIVPGNGLSPIRCQAIVWSNADLLLIETLTNTFQWNSVQNWNIFKFKNSILTHWGRVTNICVGKLTIIGSDNGLSPGRRQAIIWTNAGISLIGPLGTNFSEILIEILTFSFKKMYLKMSSGKWRPFCLGLNLLRYLLHNSVHFVEASMWGW